MNHRSIACLIAGLGASLYLVVAFGMSSVVGTDRFGIFIYNYYFLALIEGRFDVPLRIITLEGVFDSAGHGYVYYGIAPLITRALAWPFLDLTEVSLAPLTIWLAAAGGTAVYHMMFVKIIEKFAAQDAALQRSAGLLFGMMIWLASPGLLFVANTAVYHEPTALAYLFMACFLGLLAQVVVFERPIGSVLLPLALFAGLSVYGRPHLAFGLYAVVCLLSLVMLRQQGWQAADRIAGSIGILFFFGAAILVFNELRFGDILELAGGRDVQHAVLFWGTEPVDSLRRTDGGARFSAYRIAPTLMLYLFDLPIGRLSDGLMQAFRYLSSGSGYVRVEQPRVGMVFAWLPWFMLVLAGLRGGSAGLRQSWAPLLATGIGALMMASYTTVTLRYRFDIWPVLMALAMLSLPRLLLLRDAENSTWAGSMRLLQIALLPSLLVMLGTIYLYQFRFIERGLYSQWSYETCAEMVTSKQSLGPDAVGRLCGL